MNGATVADALAAALAAIPGVRVWPWPSDTFLPPGIVIGLPERDWETPDRTFCTGVWLFPITIAVARATDREAVAALYDLEEAVSDVLAEDHDLGGAIQTVRLVNSGPAIVPSNGQDFPARVLTARLIA